MDFEDETSSSEDTSQTNSKVDPVLEDDFLSGTYLPTVASLKGRDVIDMRSQLGYEDLKADVDKESPESREICYLSGSHLRAQ